MTVAVALACVLAGSPTAVGAAGEAAPPAAVAADCRPGTQNAALTTRVRDVARLAASRLRAAAAAPATRYPKSAYSGDRRWRRSSPAEWTAGFFPGALWYAYELRGGAVW